MCVKLPPQIQAIVLCPLKQLEEKCLLLYSLYSVLIYIILKSDRSPLAFGQVMRVYNRQLFLIIDSKSCPTALQYR